MVDYQQMLEDHGYRTEYKDKIAKVWAFGECFGIGSYYPDDRNKQFHLLAVRLAEEGEVFSGWSEDVAICVGGTYKLWKDVFGEGRSDNGETK